MKLKDLIEFMRNSKFIIPFWNAKQRQAQIEAFLAEELRDAGLPGDIAYNLGTAIGFARDTRIELYKGMAFSDCQAVLSRANWRYDTGDPDEVFIWGQFLHVTRKEVTAIQRQDTNICFAIAYCALFARKAGVI